MAIRGLNLSYQNLLIEKENGICIVSINRPQAMNALNDSAYAELLQAFLEIEKDAEVRAVIITGAGEKSFVAGTDVTNMAKMNVLEAKTFATTLKKTFDLISNLGKP